MKYLKLLRVNQWLKNLFIIIPVIFAFEIPTYENILKLIFAVLGFSLIASCVYIINDWKDIEDDKKHPTKKERPLASGAINKKEATYCLCISFIIAFSIYILVLNNITLTILALGYFILNIAYCFKLKRIAIIDSIIVSIGFVIRLFIGGIVTQTTLSQWIIIITFLLALLLVIGKRKHDIQILEETGKSMRKSLNGYNSEFLNAIIVIIVSSIIICYLLYTISDDVIERNGEYLYLTSIFVISGLFRYLQVIFVHKKSDSPTMLLVRDHFIQVTIILWLISFISISVIHKYNGG